MLCPSLKDVSLWEKIQNKTKDDVLAFLNRAFLVITVFYAIWYPANKIDKYDASVDARFQKFQDLKKFFMYTLRVEDSDAEEDISKIIGQ
ncbi:hypothetical protein N0V84_006168 [Fusarium piperis]|uniref:Uncharacterized protein n=1 Tax=Fusarium piperis TaxID=1435070 RepID=A0A9W8WCC9_9HYPO|nr:hypothetical protein N0V84_006168 [Fusarium piperis]